MEVENLVHSFRLTIKQKINTNMILLIAANVQNQLVTGKDKQSHLIRHVLNSNHKAVDQKDFKILTAVTITRGSEGKSQKPCILNNTNPITRAIGTIKTF